LLDTRYTATREEKSIKGRQIGQIPNVIIVVIHPHKLTQL